MHLIISGTSLSLPPDLSILNTPFNLAECVGAGRRASLQAGDKPETEKYLLGILTTNTLPLKRTLTANYYR